MARFANPLRKSRTIASTKDHVIEFPGRGSDPEDKTKEALVFVHVPDMIAHEMTAAGLQPEEHTELPDAPTSTEPLDAEGRREAMFKVFKEMVKIGAREDFGASGQPKVAAVNKRLGWANLNNAEVKDTWIKFQVDNED